MDFVVDIDKDLVTRAMKAAIEDNIKQTVKGYEINRLISQAFADALSEAAIGEVVKEAIQSLDKDALLYAITQSVSHALVHGVTKVIEESVVDIVARLRHAYTAEDRTRLKNEIFPQAQCGDAT